jgi:hypothetical protein
MLLLKRYAVQVLDHVNRFYLDLRVGQESWCDQEEL